MAHIILPSRFYNQPKFATDIDWDTDELDFVFNPAIGMFRRGLGLIAQSAGVLNVSPGTYELKHGTNALDYTIASYQLDTAQFSVVASVTGVTSAYKALVGITQSDNGSPLSINTEATTSTLYLEHSGTYYSTEPGSISNTGKFAVVKEAGGNIRLISNSQVGSAGVVTTAKTLPKLRLLTGANGDVDFALGFRRALTTEQVRSYLENPWQVFIAPKRVLYFDVGGGGANIVTAGFTGINLASGSGATSKLASASAAGSTQVASQSSSAKIAAGIVQGATHTLCNITASKFGSGAASAYSPIYGMAVGSKVAPGIVNASAAGYAPMFTASGGTKISTATLAAATLSLGSSSAAKIATGSSASHVPMLGIATGSKVAPGVVNASGSGYAPQFVASASYKISSASASAYAPATASNVAPYSWQPEITHADIIARTRTLRLRAASRTTIIEARP